MARRMGRGVWSFTTRIERIELGVKTKRGLRWLDNIFCIALWFIRSDDRGVLNI